MKLEKEHRGGFAPWTVASPFSALISSAKSHDGLHCIYSGHTIPPRARLACSIEREASGFVQSTPNDRRTHRWTRGPFFGLVYVSGRAPHHKRRDVDSLGRARAAGAAECEQQQVVFSPDFLFTHIVGTPAGCTGRLVYKHLRRSSHVPKLSFTHHHHQHPQQEPPTNHQTTKPPNQT